MPRIPHDAADYHHGLQSTLRAFFAVAAIKTCRSSKTFLQIVLGPILGLIEGDTTGNIDDAMDPLP